MTVYQAVRQFGCTGMDHSEAEADGEPPLGHDAVWVQTHTIYYRCFLFFSFFLRKI